MKPVAGEQHWPGPQQSPLVYTVGEVAVRLKVSAGTVRNMIDHGQLYALRLNVRRIVIPKWAVDDLVGRPSAITPLPTCREQGPTRTRPGDAPASTVTRTAR
ncbi:MAG: helix-turn-helix domain-containing protein [Actinobacteria bacterium]|nr:helix-turn-helix domain-containing protein [Actinomycetota bacterium]